MWSRKLKENISVVFEYPLLVLRAKEITSFF